MPSGEHVDEPGFRAAASRFPAHAEQIATLYAKDENFRGLCDDLAVAEQAITAAERLSGLVGAKRRAEYHRLVEDLAAEIEDTLRRAKIVPMPKRSEA
jgi:hypothetical protein